MFDELSNLHKKCFPNKPWSADDFRDLKKSGCEIIMSQNGFIVYRVVDDEAEIITIGVNPEMRRQGIAIAMITIIEKNIKKPINKPFKVEETALPLEKPMLLQLHDPNQFCRNQFYQRYPEQKI